MEYKEYEVFGDGDPPYFQWMNDNPNGFVVNTDRNKGSKYFTLHQSGCRHITKPCDGGYTSGAYVKVCSNDPLTLLKWASKHRVRVKGFDVICKTCKPEVYSPEEIEKTLSQAQSQDLITDLGIENETKEVKIKIIKRHQKIIAKVKQKYNSICQIESCGFTFTKENGENYSEAHHLIPLSKDGNQNESNVVILCPNHHRMFHFCSLKVFDVVGKIRHVEINGTKEKILYK